MDQEESVEVLEKPEPIEEARLLDTPVTRRRFLAIAGISLGALALGPTLTGCEDESETTSSTAAGTETTGGGGATTTSGQTTGTTDGGHGQEGAAVQPLVNLTVSQAVLLGAIVDRLIPADDIGPSGTQAGVVGYVDRALLQEADRGAAFLANLEAVNAFAAQSQGSGFADLAADRQDAVITAIQTDEATGFTPGSALFFLGLRSFVLQGMFGDPFYGGNRDFAGWRLLKFPGIRLTVPEEEQRLGVEVELDHRSVYDYNEYGYTIQGG